MLISLIAKIARYPEKQNSEPPSVAPTEQDISIDTETVTQSTENKEPVQQTTRLDAFSTKAQEISTDTMAAAAVSSSSEFQSKKK